MKPCAHAPRLQILTQLNLKQGSVESGVVYNTLHSGAFAAAMCQNEQCLPSSIILALLDLCMVKKSDNQTGMCYVQCLCAVKYMYSAVCSIQCPCAAYSAHVQ